MLGKQNLQTGVMSFPFIKLSESCPLNDSSFLLLLPASNLFRFHGSNSLLPAQQPNLLTGKAVILAGAVNVYRSNGILRSICRSHLGAVSFAKRL